MAAHVGHTVSLVIVNYNGREHLRACLDSVAELDYRHDLLETIVVDNASTDGSRELLSTSYPWVRVVAEARNLGFAGGVNAGARAATGELLATCNNDMRLDRAWLEELVRAYDPDAGVVCVSGLILDWTGETVDFADGYITAYAHAGQPGFGRPVEEVDIVDGRELPFPCGGSFLVSRDVFLELGGFDESYFALFEDVDFGWRLQLAGYRTRLAARARSYHRHHGTVGAIAQPERLFLYERNALRTLLKNVGDENLAPLLAFALFNIAHRTALLSDAERDPSVALAGPHAVAAVAAELDALLAERSRVQELRRRSDEDIFGSFGRPFFPAHGDNAHLSAAAGLIDLLGLDERFAHRQATTLLVLAAHPASRSTELAHALAEDVHVMLASPERETDVDGLFAAGDVILVDASSPFAQAAVRARPTVVVNPDAPLSPELQARKPIVLPDDDAETMLRELLRHPPRVGAPEPAQLLLTQWRRAYGVGQPFPRRLLRVTWEALPERVRAPIRRGLRRVRKARV